MLKAPESMKELESRAAGALGALIEQVPAIKLKDIKVEPPDSDHGVDILAHINVSDRPHVLVCEVKASGQPRHVRMALLQLRNYVAHFGSEATPIFIAPYLSPEAQALCREKRSDFSTSKAMPDSFSTACSSNGSCQASRLSSDASSSRCSSRNPRKCCA